MLARPIWKRAPPEEEIEESRTVAGESVTTEEDDAQTMRREHGDDGEYWRARRLDLQQTFAVDLSTVRADYSGVCSESYS